MGYERPGMYDFKSDQDTTTTPNVASTSTTAAAPSTGGAGWNNLPQSLKDSLSALMLDPGQSVDKANVTANQVDPVVGNMGQALSQGPTGYTPAMQANLGMNQQRPGYGGVGFPTSGMTAHASAPQPQMASQQPQGGDMMAMLQKLFGGMK